VMPLWLLLLLLRLGMAWNAFKEPRRQGGG